MIRGMDPCTFRVNKKTGAGLSTVNSNLQIREIVFLHTCRKGSRFFYRPLYLVPKTNIPQDGHEKKPYKEVTKKEKTIDLDKCSGNADDT